MLLAAAIAFGGMPAVHAVTSTSPNYQMTESQFGSSSADESCSGEYCARASIGDPAIGESKSPNATANFGPVTPDEPLLEVIVEPGESHLGFLETNKTATKTMGIKVRSYMSNGYMLQIVGTPPKYKDHTLATSATPVASQQGKEQFGINLVANTTPTIGASPAQVPSNELSFGEVEPAYRTPNLFKYNSGDVVARSTKESGRTDYTVSMIINVSNSTPAGRYNGDFSAVVIPVY
jgi:hypothetical protein